MIKEKIKVYLAQPRGFCAGVERAIAFVELALKKYAPAPVYVHHAIVHNTYVVNNLIRKGAIFVNALEDIPPNALAIFSAHGTPKSVIDKAKKRNLQVFDAVCPLVSRIHGSVERAYKQGYHIIYIGHQGHPEVIGTMSHIPKKFITLVETVKDVWALPNFENKLITYATQTTLSVFDTKQIIDALYIRWPHIKPPTIEDICYATKNRQTAVHALMKCVDTLVVFGSPTSSNSQRLVDIAKVNHIPVRLLDEAIIPKNFIRPNAKLGITASASAPETLVTQFMNNLQQLFTVSNVIIVGDKEKDTTFKAPEILHHD